VGIASKLFELGVLCSNDINVLVTGDTDLSPAIKTFKKIYPNSKIYAIFPFNRKNMELRSLVDGQFSLKPGKYQKHQLPEKIQLSTGQKINKPSDC